ncbi:MAG: GNAT family N-acetyltransferase [Burkholderiaceae bacterium]|jgi:RimJ/RimL family protein N-acetyltransferase|nr:GNAT family N-acetyltransferase [Burkholderiaceae bacterium]
MSTAWLDAIETPRLWLRCPQPGDGDALYSAVQESLAALRQWPDSLPWAQKPQTPERAEDYCQTCFGAFVLGLSWPMLMHDKTTGTLLGSVSFHRIDTHLLEFELGYWCRTSAHGRGLMSEAVTALSDAALRLVPAARLVCRVDERNAASCRVVEKSHYRFVRSGIESAQADRPALSVRFYERLSVPHTGQSA